MIHHQQKFNQNSFTRSTLIQALYKQEINPQTSLKKLIDEFLQNPVYKRIKKNMFCEDLQNLYNNQNDLDKLFTPFVSEQVECLYPIEQAILRLAVYELKFKLHLSPKIILNEAINLAKSFGNQNSHILINGILNSYLNNK